MRRVSATLAATGLAATTLALAGTAVAAPSGTGSAQDTVTELAAEGYKVIVNRVGSAPLDECTLTAVRAGRAITKPATSRDSGNDPNHVVQYTTIYVDASC